MRADGAEEEVGCGVGAVATVWDGEVAGIAEGLAKMPGNGKRVPGLQSSHNSCEESR